MCISDFLSTINYNHFKNKKWADSSIESNIIKYKNKFPKLKRFSIAFIGIYEKNDEKSIENLYAIREKVYGLMLSYNMKTKLKLFDLGDIICDEDDKRKDDKIKNVGQYLLKDNVLPIFIGGTKKNIWNQYNIYEQFEKRISLVVIDRVFGLAEEKKPISDANYAFNIITKQPNYLFNYTQLGYQSYLCWHEELDLMDALYFDSVRLGKIHENIESTETSIRDGDMLAFSVDALNGTVASGQSQITPFGLSPEQVAQMFWYAGQNEKLTSLGIYDYFFSNDKNNNSTAQTIAVALWYFIEGFVERKDNLEFIANDYQIYHCFIEKMNEEIVFYQSIKSDKWWFEAKAIDMKQDVSRGYLVSCTYEDYIETVKMSTEGKVPDFYIKSLERLS